MHQLSEPQFPCLSSGDTTITSFLGLLGGVSELVHSELSASVLVENIASGAKP